MRPFVVALLCSSLLLSGCSGGGGKGDGQKGRIDVGEGGLLDGEAGAVNGSVVDDIGIPVAGAFINLDGTFHNTQADSVGAFFIENVTPGRYLIRVSHPDFNSLQQVLDVAAGRITEVTVVIVIKNGAAGDMRMHLHDYWGTNTRINVIDASFEWHEPYDDSGPYSESFGRYYDTVTHANVHPCVWTDSQDEVYFNQRLIWFDLPETLVYAGTKQIEVKLDWDSQDYAGERLMLAWRGSGSPKFTEGELFAKGSTYVIPVDPKDWDSSHQSFSLWEIYMCTPEEPAPGGAVDNTEMVLGSIDVVMDLVRIEGPIPAERAHPVLWPANGTVTVVAGAAKKFGPGYALTRSTYNSNWVVRPDETDNGSVLVPPRTKELLIHLEWTTNDPQATAWSVTYRPANERFWDMKDPGEMLKPAPTAKGPTSRDYVVPVESIQTDQYYQSRSNWFFMINVEGQEASTEWSSPFETNLKMTVTAVKDPDA